jgi:V8-like Glu-specific endopeptidase
MKHLSVILVAAVFSGLAACQKSEPHVVRAIFDHSDLKLVNRAAWQTDSLSRVTGTLARVVKLDDQTVVVDPYCSAARIGVKHIVTAAHCVASGGTIIFHDDYVAQESGMENLNFYQLGRKVRVEYIGAPIMADHNEIARRKPFVVQIPYQDQEKDFAVAELSAVQQGPYLRLNQLQQADLSRLKLYGYPNGVPLTVAEPCQGFTTVSGVLRHDCDALPGSSGGLIADAAATPVALHTFEVASNMADGKALQGGFESHELLKERAQRNVDERPEEADKIFWECRNLNDQNDKKECQVGKGFNRATLLTTVADEIKTHAPALFEALYGPGE